MLFRSTYANITGNGTTQQAITSADISNGLTYTKASPTGRLQTFDQSGNMVSSQAPELADTGLAASDATGLTGLQTAQVGLAGLGAGINYLNYGLNKDNTKSQISSRDAATKLARDKYNDDRRASAAQVKAFGLA